MDADAAGACTRAGWDMGGRAVAFAVPGPRRQRRRRLTCAPAPTYRDAPAGRSEGFGMDGDVVIEFGAGGNAPGLTRGGWSEPEARFRWMVGLESFVEVPRPPPAARYVLSLSVVPHVRPPRLPRQALIVAVNGVIVGVAEVERAFTLTWEVPHWAIALFEGVTLRLIHPNATAPAEVSEVADKRLLAGAVERLELRPYLVVTPGETLQAPAEDERPGQRS
ncbi:MAG: hypothetical protein M0Z28_05945 [Rhodospirillales bacterium]|nr:hypothetical protein [Rhodospirillales bacterium]